MENGRCFFTWSLGKFESICRTAPGARVAFQPTPKPFVGVQVMLRHLPEQERHFLFSKI